MRGTKSEERDRVRGDKEIRGIMNNRGVKEGNGKGG